MRKFFSILFTGCLFLTFFLKIDQASAFSGGCKTLVKWVGQFEREFPGMDLKYVDGKPGFMLKFANLFRDTYFVPVFGKSYEPQSSDFQADLLNNVIKKCSGLEKYTKILQGAFGEGYNRHLWSKRIDEAVKIHKDQESWIKETSSAIANSHPAFEDFEKLRELSRQGKAHVFALWPSEKSSFDSLKDNLEQRMNQVVQDLGSKTLDEVAGMTASLKNAHTLKFEILVRNAEFGEALESSNDTGKWEETYNKKLDSMITALVEKRTELLNGISSSVEGLQESIDWKKTFEDDFARFTEFQQVQNAIESVFPKKREGIFQTIKPDFVAILNVLPPSLDNLSEGDKLLNTLFSLSVDQTLTSYREYQEILEGYKDGMLSKLVAVRLEPLNSIPPTIAGALTMLHWKQSLEEDFSDYLSYDPIKSAQSQWQTRRIAILQQAKDEFLAKQETLPASKRGLSQTVEMLDNIFPTLEDEKLSIYQEYLEIVLSQIQAIRGRMGG